MGYIGAWLVEQFCICTSPFSPVGVCMCVSSHRLADPSSDPVSVGPVHAASVEPRRRLLVCLHCAGGTAEAGEGPWETPATQAAGSARGVSKRLGCSEVKMSVEQIHADSNVVATGILFQTCRMQ